MPSRIIQKFSLITLNFKIKSSQGTPSIAGTRTFNYRIQWTPNARLHIPSGLSSLQLFCLTRVNTHLTNEKLNTYVQRRLVIRFGPRQNLGQKCSCVFLYTVAFTQ
jgi:hypothetical protein